MVIYNMVTTVTNMVMVPSLATTIQHVLGFHKDIAGFTKTSSFNPKGVGKNRGRSFAEFTFDLLDSLPNFLHASIRVYGGYISHPGLFLWFLQCFPANSLQSLVGYFICYCGTSHTCFFLLFPVL